MIRRLMLATALMAAAPALAEDVTTFQLKNGLDVVVIEDHRAPVVVQMVWYKAGSADEQRGVSGVAHFLEHLMFKGTEKVPDGQLSKIVEANGGSDNAFTSYDYTAYFQRVAADRLDLMMTMEADRMRNLILSPDDWKTERDVIIEERNQRTDSNPDSRFAEQFRAAQFLNSPYGTPVIGWKQEMSSLTRQDALDWYQKYYAPNDAILVVAGDVRPDDVKRMAEAHYGPLKPSDGIAVRHRPQEPEQIAARRLSFSDPRVSHPYVMRSYLAPERNAGDQKRAAALTVLAELLGGNQQTSVLGKALLFGTKQAIYASASYDGTSYDPTTFTLYVAPVDGVSLDDAEKAMDKVVADFMKNGVDPAQLDRIKTEIRASLIYAKDDTEGLARDYGEALATGLTVKDVQDWPGILAAVTADDVMAAAQDVFNPDRSVTGWVQRPDGAPADTAGAPALPNPANNGVTQ